MPKKKGWLEKNLEDNEFCRCLIKEQDEEIRLIAAERDRYKAALENLVEQAEMLRG